MAMKATDFLGADLVLRGTSPAVPEQIDTGIAAGLRHSHVVEFSSVVATEDAIQLSAIKSVDSSYPLRGELRSASTLSGQDAPGGVPKPGEAWAEARIFAALSVDVGDEIEIGRQRFRLARVLTKEPDRGNELYSLSPHVIINDVDLAATNVIQPGSRVRYRELWSGEQAQLVTYRASVAPALRSDQQLESIKDSNQQISSALQRAERYLNLASLTAVLLAGVAVALSAARFAARRFDNGALLRCMGLSSRSTIVFFGCQLFLVGIAASLLGASFGWLGQLALFHLLAGLVPQDIPGGGLLPAVSGIGNGLVALLGFALPPLAALSRVPPLRVLRRDLLPLPPGIVFVYGAAFVALGTIMWRLSLDLTLTVALLGGGAITGLILGGILLICLKAIRRALANGPLAWRLGLGQLLRRPGLAIGQILAFGLIFLSMSLIGLLRGELLNNWQTQLPDDAPNHFVINVMPAELDGFGTKVREISPNASALYPMVAGRLVAINGQPAGERLEQGSRGERATQRDLNLTWSAALPAGNEVVAGEWWQGDGDASISLEEGLADSLGVAIGDRLSFDIAGNVHDVPVASLRTVDWNNFQPNFFVIFSPGSLQDAPVTFITSFYVPNGQEASVIELARQFPTVSILPVAPLLDQLREILEQVSVAIEFVLLFVLAAGLTVLFAALQSTLDERVHQDALLRALGARRKILVAARRSEFLVVGLASGMFAAAGCELATFLLYRYAFDLVWQPHAWLLLVPIITALVVGGAGLLGTRKALSTSPLTVLRET
jgi:putative ABC transport system permease protein